MMFAPTAGAQVLVPACPPAVTAGMVSAVTCSFTGGPQTWTVPAGVTSATFDLFGASSGAAHGSSGAGGETTATIAVTPGAVYQVMVGGKGGDIPDGQSLVAQAGPAVGGFNGGGDGGIPSNSGDIRSAGGGGASDVRLNGACATSAGCTLADRIAVAGGGGAGGVSVYNSVGAGGNGGGTSGGDGTNAANGGFGGGGGTQSMGGAGGTSTPGQCCGTAPVAGSGTLGQGGSGSAFVAGSGGGGGGGYYGGGGGGGASVFNGGSAGGGGGSALIPAGGTTLSGVRANNDGVITITYSQAQPSYPSVVLAQDPVGYWRFAEPSGTTLVDSSGHANNGTYLGGVALGAPGVIAGNTAATFDGINDTARVPQSPSLNVAGTFSVEGWIKRTSTAKAHELFNKGANGLQLTVMSSANGNQVWLRKAGVTTIARSAGGVPADGAYHHVVATMSGAGTARIYIDGQLDTVAVSNVQAVAATTFPLTFGSAGSTPANYDEFALYNHVLTAAEVNAHFTAALPG